MRRVGAAQPKGQSELLACGWSLLGNHFGGDADCRRSIGTRKTVRTPSTLLCGQFRHARAPLADQSKYELRALKRVRACPAHLHETPYSPAHRSEGWSASRGDCRMMTVRMTLASLEEVRELMNLMQYQTLTGYPANHSDANSQLECASSAEGSDEFACSYCGARDDVVAGAG